MMIRDDGLLTVVLRYMYVTLYIYAVASKDRWRVRKKSWYHMMLFGDAVGDTPKEKTRCPTKNKR